MPLSIQLSLSRQRWVSGSVPRVACRGPRRTVTVVRCVRQRVGAVVRAAVTVSVCV